MFSLSSPTNTVFHFIPYLIWIYTSNVCTAQLRNQTCYHWISRQEQLIRLKQDMKPCCLPDTWKARFKVHTMQAGHYPNRIDHGAFRIHHHQDGTVQSALLVIGQNVYSSEFCSFNSTDQSNITRHLCPDDRIACMEAPFLGEPRCITNKDGYTLKKSKKANRKGQVKQIWFIDKTNGRTGYVERHLYHVIRQYDLCQLKRYQIQWGHYAVPWKSCRLLVWKEQTYHPLPGSFRIQFDQTFRRELLFC